MRRQGCKGCLVWVPQMAGAIPGFMPLYMRRLLRAEKGEKGHIGLRTLHLQDSRTTLHPSGPVWGPMGLRARHTVSHAGHLWEAWQHNPPAFDPLITHHRHSELDSFLLPIIIHKLRESAPTPPKLQMCQDMGLYTASPHPPP